MVLTTPVAACCPEAQMTARDAVTAKPGSVIAITGTVQLDDGQKPLKVPGTASECVVWKESEYIEHVKMDGGKQKVELDLMETRTKRVDFALDDGTGIVSMHSSMPPPPLAPAGEPRRSLLTARERERLSTSEVRTTPEASSNNGRSRSPKREKVTTSIATAREMKDMVLKVGTLLTAIGTAYNSAGRTTLHGGSLLQYVGRQNVPTLIANARSEADGWAFAAKVLGAITLGAAAVSAYKAYAARSAQGVQEDDTADPAP